MSQRQWKNYSDKEKKTVKVILSALLCLMAVIFLSAIFSDSNQKDKRSTFSGNIIKTDVVDPASIRVYYEVRNTGNTVGKANCTIDASNDNGTYRGFDTFSIDALNPGEKSTIKSDLTITKEGARYITKTSISCS